MALNVVSGLSRGKDREGPKQTAEGSHHSLEDVSGSLKCITGVWSEM